MEPETLAVNGLAAMAHHGEFSDAAWISVSFWVDGLDEIVHWVLGWTARVTVVRPVELRQLIVAELREALSLNDCEVGP